MKNVLLVGAGNLGRRHLQSMKNSAEPFNIFVVEPFEAAREQAEKIFQETKSDAVEKVVSFHKAIEEIDKEIDIVIDATPASGRLDILKQVLALGAKDLVLEKVAFNSVPDIEKAKVLIEKYNARAWVNCPRRLNPFYIQLREIFENLKIDRFEVVGENFGMACNAIHFIDLFAFLAKKANYHISLDNISEILPSKRHDYIEFFGEITGTFESGPDFKIDCQRSTKEVGFKIRIVTLTDEYVIDEIAGNVEIIKTDGSKEVSSFRQPYQSELTGGLIDEIISKQACGLTEFYESMALHSPFISNAYVLYASNIEENSLKMVPIT
ncbi:Gfo/Idh/MocA family oxidoreductase [Halomonas alkaliantarctica]|uniref:Gfo/Idh/MocA family oxidoreductase n=1 Tax=Halomonas alkaliantarctica TaxID=232346 RepID=A0ABY8LTA3_9GAMM|nr:Gfo/Idh/MocA family oxidoreductase [Halomonas alkaliantarctica]WGI26627.1 Gfo/Idh/MocA family oxidoreductase [Halomonas alkaliantarctica]